MDLHHSAVHGRHRRKRARRRLIVIGLAALALLAGVCVAVLVWPGGDPSSDGREQTVASGGSSSSSHDEHARVSAAPSTPPAASSGSPGVGSAVATGMAPHDMVVAPDGRFAYIADPVAGAVMRTAGGNPYNTSVARWAGWFCATSTATCAPRE